MSLGQLFLAPFNANSNKSLYKDRRYGVPKKKNARNSAYYYRSPRSQSMDYG